MTLPLDKRVENLEAAVRRGGGSGAAGPVGPAGPPGDVGSLLYFPGELDLGAGAAANAGYSITGTTWTPVDLTQDLIIPAEVGQEIDAHISFTVVGGAGITYFDILSVNSGEQFGDPTPGWSELQCAASTTTRKNARLWKVMQPDDVVDHSATFRLITKVASGTSTLLANDTDGHARMRVWPIGSVSVIPGSNTGQPPPTPPDAGTVTDRGTTNNTTGTTLASGNYNATAGSIQIAISHLWMSNITVPSVTFTIADTIADTGGTAWTSREFQCVTDGVTGSLSLRLWTRTIGTSPGTGKAVTVTHNTAANRNCSLTVLELNGYTEAPTQHNGQTAGNQSTVTFPITLPGTTDMAIASVFNSSGAITVAPGVPTIGGTWTSVDDAVRNGDGHGTFYKIEDLTTSIILPGLTAIPGESTPAVYCVFTPSGSSTPAPGTETWTVADKTSDINGDMTWVQM